MKRKHIVYEKKDNIAVITFNRPDKLNTFDFPGQGGIADEFFSTLEEAAADDDLKVVIIKGAGSSFSAGHDLTVLESTYGLGTGKSGEKRQGQSIRLRNDRLWFEKHMMLLTFPKYTIAQVHGYCVGEGLTIVEDCDIAVAAEDAKLGHIGDRIVGPGTGIPTLPVLILKVGLTRALDLITTGKMLSGKEAAEIDLVTTSVPSDQLEEEVTRRANLICLSPADGIAIGKALRHSIYERLGLLSGYINAYSNHTLFTNARFRPGEFNLLKEKRDKGAKNAFHELHGRYH